MSYSQTSNFGKNTKVCASNLRAFTLVEVLLAMSIAGIVMTSIVAILFNMVKLMDAFETENTFQSHVDKVETFLNGIILTSSFPSDADEGLIGKVFAVTDLVRLSHLPDETDVDDLRICFGVENDHPFFLSRNGMSAEKFCWLNFKEGEGLSIIWCFAKEDENIFALERPLFQSVVSPYITSVTYFYKYEEGGFKEEDRIATGSDASAQLPVYIKLRFENGDEILERVVLLNTSIDSAIYNPESSSSSTKNSSSSGGASRDGGGNSGDASGGRGGGGRAGGAKSK